MSDLTKLTACELVAHLDGREHAEMCGTCDYSKEAERRLERLEKCEAALKQLAMDLGPIGKIARAALEGK